MSYIDNMAALASHLQQTTQTPQHPMQTLSLPIPAPGATSIRDPTWLQVEVCREFLRQSCKRDNTECKYAHPNSNVDVQNGKVTVCFDAFKDRCTRSSCKYFHAPAQMKADLEMRGKISLMRQKNEQMAQAQAQALHSHSFATAAAAAQQNSTAAQLALLQLHNPLLNPFMQNNTTGSTPLFQSSATTSAVALAAAAQYQQLLQQNYASLTSSLSNHHSPPQPAPPPPTSLQQHQQNQQQQLLDHCAAAAAAANSLALVPNSNGILVNSTNGIPPTSTHMSHTPVSVSPSSPKVLTTIEVCRDFSRGSCPRSDEECRYAHPEPHVAIDPNDNGVTVCMDFTNTGVCSRAASDKCKFFHPPKHLQEQLNNNNFQLLQSHFKQQQTNNHMLTSQFTTIPNGINPLFTFQSPISVQQTCANGNYVPQYGKMLRLDSSGVGTPLNGIAATKNGSLATTGGLNGMTLGTGSLFSPTTVGSYGGGGVSVPSTTPSPYQSLFYTHPLYQSQLAAAAAAALKSTQPLSIIPPPHSPAFISNHGAAVLNGSTPTAAI